ncbi:Protein of unknown function [Cotesia congregata]|uniref:Uncharacterized protein n=1 Tax=Cotesia congregata TaxID=51543 RepID=A0A8J2HI55_COTCN|nr:Protein of unknown function [Cotesia congregata]
MLNSISVPVYMEKKIFSSQEFILLTQENHFRQHGILGSRVWLLSQVNFFISVRLLFITIGNICDIGNEFAEQII